MGLLKEGRRIKMINKWRTFKIDGGGEGVKG